MGKPVLLQPAGIRFANHDAGDTLVLAAGNYGITAGGADTGDVPGLPIFNLNGTPNADQFIEALSAVV